MKILVALFLVSISGSVQAKGFVTGEKLARQAAAWSRVHESDRPSTQDQTDAARFEGYIEGAIEGGEGREWCLSAGVQAPVVFGQVANFIARHPDIASESGYAILQDAFSVSWPCPRQ